MPSGSHGGSPGSHSSGGSSRGGSSWGGSSRSSSSYSGGGGHYHRGYHRSTYVFLGHSGTMSGHAAGILLFVILAIVCSIVMGVFIPTQNKKLNKCKEDYKYYHAMIIYAQSNNDYITEGTVTDMFEFGSSGKYYITYTFKDYSNRDVKGYSYSTYSLAQAQQLLHDRTILLAVNNKNTSISSDTDSIPMNYLNFGVKDDAEYLQIKKTRDIIISVCSILIIVSVALIILFIIKSAKSKTQTLDENGNPIETEDDSSSDTAATTLPKQHTCKYCGSTLSDDAKRCPNCGASAIK